MSAPRFFTASLRKFDSKGELFEFVRKSTLPSHILGQNADAPREFYCIAVQESELVKANIAVLSFGIGVKPSWVFQMNTLFVGFNDRIGVLDLTSFSLLKEICVLSLFWEFVVTEQCPHIYVLCETALVAISDTGSVSWRYETDLIIDHKRVGNTLRLEFSDARPIDFDLLSGKILTAE